MRPSFWGWLAGGARAHTRGLPARLHRPRTLTTTQHQNNNSTRHQARKKTFAKRDPAIGAEFPVDMRFREALETKLAVTAPNAVQRESFVSIFNGDSTLLSSETGSGKTIAFALPLLQRLMHLGFPRFHTLCLVPTRELAVQIQGVVDSLASRLVEEREKDVAGLSHALKSPDAARQKVGDTPSPPAAENRAPIPARIVRAGNVSQLVVRGISGATLPKQIRKLERMQPSIIVATPKQMLALLNEYPIYDEFQTIVLDEADKLLDPLPRNTSEKKRLNRLKNPRPATSIVDLVVYQKTFSAKDDRRDYQSLARNVQIIAASASLTAGVRREIVQRGWKHPKDLKRVLQSDGKVLPKTLAHFIVDESVCRENNLPFQADASPSDQANTLFDQLQWTLSTLSPRTALIFVPTSVPVSGVVEQLRKRFSSKDEEAGAAADVIAFYEHVHAASSANDASVRRKEMLDLFAKATPGKMAIGVVNLEAVRGLDIPQVDVACMVGTPRTHVDYMHAVGRVARNNSIGVAVTLAYDAQQKARTENMAARLGVTLSPLAEDVSMGTIARDFFQHTAGKSSGDPVLAADETLAVADIVALDLD